MMILYEGGVYFMPLNSHPKGESGIRSGIGHQSGKETKTENISVHHKKILDGGQKMFFFMDIFAKSGVWGFRNLD